MFGLEKKFITNDYFNDLKNEIIFNNDDIVIDGVIIKEERSTAWMSDNDHLYSYGHKIMKSQPMSKTVNIIQQIIQQKYGELFDSVLINYYKNGNIGMRYHSDEIYDEWNEHSVIVSFGSTRKLVFRLIENYDDKTYLDFSSGDLIYMKEGCQKLYQHRVIKNSKITGDRISLVYKKHI